MTKKTIWLGLAAIILAGAIQVYPVFAEHGAETHEAAAGAEHGEATAEAEHAGGEHAESEVSHGEAGEAKHGEAPHGGEHAAAGHGEASHGEAAHGEGGGGHGEEGGHGTPDIYYVDWLLILACFGIITRQTQKLRQKQAQPAHAAAAGGAVEAHGHSAEAHGAEAHGHEAAAHGHATEAAAHGQEAHHAPSGGGLVSLVLVILVFTVFFLENLPSLAHFHEPSGVGLLRLAVKFACGIMLMLYGLSFHSAHGHGDDAGHGQAHGH